VKQARVAGWSEVGVREASLVQRCAAGEETACAELVAEHQRMVVQLAVNLLGDREEALDLSRAVDSSHLDLPHRHQSGKKPAPVLATAAPCRSGLA
jgi:hypothetical protein